ncbi:hypothetical protein [Nocardia sp. NPDC051750]|uniref:hypothetical protein n=1 Tax=Nocardia sp. NPDC051750 TaxID=3364325 RepID=UPI0037A0C354
MAVSAFAALYVLGYLVTVALRSRRIVHRVDHRVAEVMGRSVVDSMIDHDIRNRHSLPGFARLMLAVYSPTEAQRAQRLDTTFGRHLTAGQAPPPPDATGNGQPPQDAAVK